MDMSLPEPFSGQPEDCASQVAALCWRLHKGHVQVLLITSRETGRWVIPKGWPMAGLSAADAAAREAWEEAGVEGKIGTEPLGQFTYDKLTKPTVSLRCVVAVFALKVQALKARYPEAKQRRRAWFAASDAAELVAEPDLQHLLRLVGMRPGLLRAVA